MMPRKALSVLGSMLVVLVMPAVSLHDCSACSSVAFASVASESNIVSMTQPWLLFQPLRANVFEPRVGSFYQVQDNRLRLDIGNSLDLVRFPVSFLHGAEGTVGGDFFTFTRLRSEANFRFPVETTDFFFGINASLRAPVSNDVLLAARLRIAHISAHLVDGIDSFRHTFVYSREFVDAVVALQWKTFRFYAGANVLFHTIPSNFGILTPQLGFDVYDYSTLEALSRSIAPLSAEPLLGLCAGYDVKFPSVNGQTSAVHGAQAGLRLGKQYGTGVLLGLYWFEGRSMHGMFYKQRDSYLGIGFQLDF